MATLKYRPSIDGLRAVAVVSVILFHLNRNWLPGGFVGVDVFFVISGYLITSIILKEFELKTFSLGKFYQRRVSRIFPALFIVSLFTIIGAFFIYSPQDFASAGANLAATSLSLANIKLMTQGNYFTLSPDAQPFLHTWSLSVEEQFYIIFPLFLFVLYRYFRTNRTVAWGIIFALVSSFALCIYLTILNPTWAFFLLPTRAWELLAGCSLAIISESKNGIINSKVNDLLSNLGILLLLASLFFIKESDAFPGFIALLPVLGATLVIGPNTGAQSLSEKILSLAPFVFVGQISYSLYLWHWPIFSFVDYRMYESSSTTRIALKIIITLTASIICYFCVERPARSFFNQSKRRMAGFTTFGCVAIIFVIAGLSIRNDNYLNANANSVKTGGIIINKNSSTGSIILMGDSNGSMYGNTVEEIANKLGFKLNVISVAAGDPLPDSQLWRDSLATIQKEKPNFLIMAVSWNSKLKGREERLVTAINELDKYCDQIILITQPPVLPDIANRETIRQNGLQSFREDPSVNFERKKANQIVKNQQSEKVIVIDIESLFMEPTGEIRFLNRQGQQLYQDAGHLSATGSALVQDMIQNTIISRVSQRILSR